MFLILVLAMSDPAIFLGDPMQSFSLETADAYFDGVEKAALHQEMLVLMDSQNLHLWTLNLETGKVASYTGRGSGPGEVSTRIVGMYPFQTEIHVLHAAGVRKEVFNYDGALISSKRQPEPTFYQQDDLTVYRKDGAFVVDVAGEQVDVTPAFDKKVYGYAYESAVYESLLMLATGTTNNDTFLLHVIDVENGRVQDSITVDKVLRDHEPGLPTEISKEFERRGRSPKFFYARCISPIVAHPKWGFFFHEYTLHKDQSPGVSVVYQYHPQYDGLRRLRVKHTAYDRLELLFPYQGQTWLGYDSLADQVLVFEADQSLP